MKNLTHITADEIKYGLDRALVHLINAERYGGDGVACEIGFGSCSNWFYFAGQEGESMTAAEYMRDVPLDDIAREIEDALSDFENGCEDEYQEWLFYRYMLNKQ